MTKFTSKQVKQTLKDYNTILLNVSRHGIYTDYNFLTQTEIEMTLSTKTKNGTTSFSLQVKNLNGKKLNVPSCTNLYEETMSFTDDNETINISADTIIEVLEANM